MGMSEERTCFVSVDMLEKPKFTEDTIIKNVDESFNDLKTDKYGALGDALDKHLKLLDYLCKLGVRIQNNYFKESFQEDFTAGRVRLTKTGDILKISSYTVFCGNKVSVLLTYKVSDGVLKGVNCEDIEVSGTLLGTFIEVLDRLLEANIREVVAIYNLMVVNDILSGLAGAYKVRFVDKVKAEKHVISNIGFDFVDLIVDKDALLNLQGSKLEELYLKSPLELAENVYSAFNVLEFLRNIKLTVLGDYVKAVKKLGARQKVKLLSLIKKDFKLVDLENRHHFVYGYYRLDGDVLRLFTMSEPNIYVNTVAIEVDTNDFVDTVGEMYQFDNGMLYKVR